MVQKEIKKRTLTYGIIGVISAIVLIAMIYSYGMTGVNSPLNPSTANNSPGTSPNTASLPANGPAVSSLKTFSSTEDLANFLANNSGRSADYYGVNSAPQTAPVSSPASATGSNAVNGATPLPEPSPTAAPSAASVTSPSLAVTANGNGHSTTNIQVAGVDEADTVKTDGEYLYVIANNSVYVLNADPQNAKVVSKIAPDNSYLNGIYLSQDGNRLVVLGTQYVPYAPDLKSSDSSGLYIPYWGGSMTFVNVYDVSDKASPVLSTNITLSGNYFDSRMINGTVYTIVTESVYLVNGTVNLPVVYAGAVPSAISPERIYYTGIYDSYFNYATLIGLNILDSSQSLTNTTIMMGGASTMYVSANNIYLISPTWNDQGQYSDLYRVSIDNNALDFQAKGQVPGDVLNQYSMDENNGYFRLATTQWITDNATTSDGAVFQVSRQENNIYVLDMNLAVVGKLERFKMDESLTSARFIGDKCYVVTFRQTDPFFVIDLSNPAAPKVAGQLSIPGYSSYLYPLDANHLIGLGKENNTVKLSLFDVTNVNAPSEIARFVVDASYSDSQALQDPKAFLYDAAKQTLVIPISIVPQIIITPMYAPQPANSGSAIIAPTPAPSYWQGAYVFSVNSTSGFTLRGNVTQIDSSNINDTSYYGGANWINRAAYIGNTLYTFSDSKVQLNNIDTLAFLAEIDLN